MNAAAKNQPKATDLQAYRATARDWWGLVVLAGAVLLVAVDGTVLDLALPFVSSDLRPSSVELLWIIDVYSFVLAGLLLTMGTLGDRIGRRKLLLVGAAGFGFASLIAAWSINPEMLIAARVLQGISGATLMPATLGLIRSMFVDSRQRMTAIGIWGAMAGGGAAAGPLIGGWLLEHYWWGSVFLINIPVMLVLVSLGPFFIPESKDPEPGRFDLISAGLSLAALVPLVFAVKEVAAHGVSARVVVAIVLGLGAGTSFVMRQKLLRDPMIDLSLFAKPSFSAAVSTNLLSIFALAGVLFFGAQYLQLVLGYSPLHAGLLLLPGTLASAVASLLAARLARSFGPSRVLVCALIAAGLGALLLLGLQVDSGPTLFAAGFVLIGAGDGIALTVTSAMVVSAVEPERAGAASAISETAYELGIALGVAVLGSVVLAVFRSGLDVSTLTESQGVEASETLGGAISVAGNIGGSIGDALTTSARSAFLSGMHVAAGATAAVMIGNAALVWRLRRS